MEQQVGVDTMLEVMDGLEVVEQVHNTLEAVVMLEVVVPLAIKPEKEL